ncbi:ficolin-2-like [Patiria miniata]|uniref:Fibrinogen C-terminal domain-containing protein n=1 Tax=Patiria miniata TaxID=46514 RepID=A0A913Z027_PATMI|nr:ficolin-2-like [Patiria miniata]
MLKFLGVVLVILCALETGGQIAQAPPRSPPAPDKTCCGGIYNGAAGGSPVHMPTNCQDIRELGGGRDGIYTIFPAFSDTCRPVRVYCDQSNQGGGWTVIQRRLDGRLDFNRDWASYRDGFGYNSGELWLGNEVIHAISAQAAYELLVILEDWQFTLVESHYRNFYLGSEATNYTLRVAGFTGGPGGDALSAHNGAQFSTYDRDNDRWAGNCAVEYTGAWWYSTCHNSNLNGQYLRGIVGAGQNAKGVVWFTFHGYGYSLKTSIMMIRPKF